MDPLGSGRGPEAKPRRHAGRLRILVVAVQKGGAGKTTLASSLAVAAGEEGEKVAALDLDPQGSLAGWGDLRADDAVAVIAGALGIGQFPESWPFWPSGTRSPSSTARHRRPRPHLNEADLCSCRPGRPGSTSSPPARPFRH